MSVTGERVRYRVDPRDVPPGKAARRLHLTLNEFQEIKEELYRRGFPRPDPTTGMYDLQKIDKWMDMRDQGETGEHNEDGVLDPRAVMREMGWADE